MLLLLISPICSLAQLQIGGNAGCALNTFDDPNTNKTGYATKAVAAYEMSDAVKAGLGYRRTNALEAAVNSVFAFIDFGGHFGKFEAYAGPEIGYFPYRGAYPKYMANTTYRVSVSGFGVELGAHSGCSYYFSKVLALNAQIGYIISGIRDRERSGWSYPGSRWQPEYIAVGAFRSFEFTLGLRYNLRFKEKNEDMSLSN